MTPLVSVLVAEGRVTASLLGRLTRVGGVPIAAEVAISSLVRRTHPDQIGGMDVTMVNFDRVTRFTLVPVEYVAPINDEAKALMADEGPKDKGTAVR